MNKGGLVAEVAKRTGLSKAEVGRVVDATIDAIRDSVVEGDRVTLADFGTFERKHRNQRIARNPRQPDVPIVVPARDLPSFTPGKEFRAAGGGGRDELTLERHECADRARTCRPSSSAARTRRAVRGGAIRMTPSIDRASMANSSRSSVSSEPRRRPRRRTP